MGTNIIRTFNPDWHINSLKAKLVEGTNYFIDDLRFINEAQVINNLEGTTIRITRPNRIDSRNDITSHRSEVEQDSITVDYTIINDGTIKQLAEKIAGVMEQIND